MKTKILLTLVTLSLILVGSNLYAAPVFVPKINKYSANYRTKCILMGVVGGNNTPQSDPMAISLLQRIADQQAQLLANQQTAQLLGAQQKTSGVDPQLMALLTAAQDRVLDAINQNKVDSAANLAAMRELVAGQERILVAINNQRNTPAVTPQPPQPPVIVIPPSTPTPLPPIVITPGVGSVPGPGGVLNPLPGVGGPIQTIPGPGGALNLIPPAGGSLQALPGPGGSIMVLPGGVKPPEGSKPSIGGPPVGGPTQGLPGAGSPIPGMPESKDPVVYKTIFPKLTNTVVPKFTMDSRPCPNPLTPRK